MEALKLYRELTGAGLMESQGYIDGLERNLRTESPEKFRAPARKGGCAVSAAVLILALIAAAAAAGRLWG
jgi:ribosomal protein L7/L12